MMNQNHEDGPFYVLHKIHFNKELSQYLVLVTSERLQQKKNSKYNLNKLTKVWVIFLSFEEKS